MSRAPETITEIAARYGLNRSTVNTEWALHPRWPAPVGRYRADLYDPAAVDAWVSDRTVETRPEWIPEGLYTLREISDRLGINHGTLRAKVQFGNWPPADDTSGKAHLWFGSTIQRSLSQGLGNVRYRRPLHCT
ncbi:hypothetical protein ACFXD5_06690 [Streptomyces sp. NPDC059385]|uniref:hypothetical protein n=1 Tax=Streptomyces sp. NPDC059385 TaxID=3346817 RepID=UPI0036758982